MSSRQFHGEEGHTYQHQPHPVPFFLSRSGLYSRVHQAYNPIRKGALRGRYIHSRAGSMRSQELETQSASTGLTHVAPRPETPEPTTATFMNLVMHDGEKKKGHDTRHVMPSAAVAATTCFCLHTTT